MHSLKSDQWVTAADNERAVHTTHDPCVVVMHTVVLLYTTHYRQGHPNLMLGREELWCSA